MLSFTKMLLHFCESSPVHLADSIAKGVYVGRVMGGEDDGFAISDEPLQQPTHLLNSVLIKSIHGLIEYEKLGILHDGLRDPETLAHTEGVFAHGLFHIGIEPDEADGVLDSLFVDLFIDGRKYREVSEAG